LSLLTHDEKKRQSKLIQNQLQKTLTDEVGIWVAYKNLNDEPEILWDEVSSQIKWAFPKLKNDQLEFCLSVSTFNRSALGFLEPVDGTQIYCNEIAGFILPGLAYDKQGYRLGRGKAYYDRALANYRGKKIAVCFEASLCEELPHEEHDIKCDQIITPSKVCKINQFEGVSKWN